MYDPISFCAKPKIIGSGRSAILEIDISSEVRLRLPFCALLKRKDHAETHISAE
jgi:hypothetical protein